MSININVSINIKISISVTKSLKTFPRLLELFRSITLYAKLIGRNVPNHLTSIVRMLNIYFI